MDQQYDTYAYFWVAEFDCEPEFISRTLGLEPSRAFKKGDLVSENTDRRWKHSSWEYFSTLPRTEPCQDAHIENLIKIMLERKDKILQLQSTYEVGINCVGHYYNANPGFHMSSDLIKKCAELGVSIDFDLYNGEGILEI